MSRQFADTVKYGNWLIRVGSFIAANAALFPDGIYVWSNSADAAFYGENAKENLTAAARAIRKEFGAAKSLKEYDSAEFRMEIEIPNSYFTFALRTSRSNVCRKVETGETITKTVRDYSQAPTKEITEEVIRWECDPSVLAE